MGGGPARREGKRGAWGVTLPWVGSISKIHIPGTGDPVPCDPQAERRGLGLRAEDEPGGADPGG